MRLAHSAGKNTQRGSIKPIRSRCHIFGWALQKLVHVTDLPVLFLWLIQVCQERLCHQTCTQVLVAEPEADDFCSRQKLDTWHVCRGS